MELCLSEEERGYLGCEASHGDMEMSQEDARTGSVMSLWVVNGTENPK